MKVFSVINASSYAENFPYVIFVKPFGEQTVANAQKDQLQVPPERPGAEVREIQVKLRRQKFIAVESARIRGRSQDLFLVAVKQGRQIRYPRLHPKDRQPSRVIALNVLRYFRAGSNQAHVTLQHIKELGKLVKLELPKEGPNSGDTMVSRRRDRTAGNTGAHGPKFPNDEKLAVASHSSLTEEDRRTVIPEDQEGDRDKKRR
jgi:hypothetical protein